MRVAEIRLAAGWLVFGLMIPPASCQPVAEATLRQARSQGAAVGLLRHSPTRPLLPPSPGILRQTRHPLIAPIPQETRAYRRTFRILLAHPETTDRYDELILKHAMRHGLDPRLVKAVIVAESEFDPKAVSPAGALGLMQLMPETAREMGVPKSRLRDPEHNIVAGTAYLEVLFRTAWIKFNLKGVRYHEAPIWLVQRVLAAYNAGPSHLNRPHRLSHGYVQKILLFYRSRVTDIRRAPQPATAPSLPLPEPQGLLY